MTHSREELKATTELVHAAGTVETLREVNDAGEVALLRLARSLNTIVAAGPNSAIPQHRPTDAALAEGDFVKIDFGAVVACYHSDMTRTFVLGKPPTGSSRSTSVPAPGSSPNR